MWRSASRALLLGLALWGCASLTGAPGRDPDAELVDVSSRMLGSLIDDKARLLGVAHRLTMAAAPRCGPLARPRVGALLGSGESARNAWVREAGERDHGLSSELRVLRLVPGGAFERAGIQEGDALLAIGDASPGSLGDLRRYLVLQQRDDFSVRIRRGDEERAFSIRLDMACPVLFELSSETILVPRRRDRIVVWVARGLLHYAHSDDRLAAALAHQLAHMLFDLEGQSDLDSELRADRLGLALATGAGYDAAEVIAYWEDVARAHPQLVLPRPRSATRRAILAEFYDHYDLARRMGPLREAVSQLASGPSPARLAGRPGGTGVPDAPAE